MKKEIQIKETKRLIVKALMQLLETTEYNKISIKKICEVAYVSRMSFYRHFQQVDDVIRYIYEIMNDEILQRLVDDDKKSLGKLLMIRLHILKNNDHMKSLVSCKQTLDLMFEYSKYEYIMFQNTDIDKISQTDKDFIIGGLEYIIKKWLESGMEEEIPTLIRSMLNLVGTILANYDIYINKVDHDISQYLRDLN